MGAELMVPALEPELCLGPRRRLREADEGAPVLVQGPLQQMRSAPTTQDHCAHKGSRHPWKTRAVPATQQAGKEAHSTP